MINFIIIVTLCVIAVEAITEIIVDSLLFQSVKSWLFDIDPTKTKISDKLKLFSFKLMNCGYCTSVWVSGVVVFFTIESYGFENLSKLPLFLQWLGMTFVIHRLSNWLHVIYEYVRKGRVLTFDITNRKESDTETIVVGEQDE